VTQSRQLSPHRKLAKVERNKGTEEKKGIKGNRTERRKMIYLMCQDSRSFPSTAILLRPTWVSKTSYPKCNGITESARRIGHVKKLSGQNKGISKSDNCNANTEKQCGQ
jgi:hypothetical protein